MTLFGYTRTSLSLPLTQIGAPPGFPKYAHTRWAEVDRQCCRKAVPMIVGDLAQDELEQIILPGVVRRPYGTRPATAGARPSGLRPATAAEPASSAECERHPLGTPSAG